VKPRVVPSRKQGSLIFITKTFGILENIINTLIHQNFTF